MPNSISATGLTTATQAELVAQFTAAMQAIYGNDINLASNTPDGQMMMIFIQAVLDLEDLLVQIYNTFDPDNAIGVILDQRVAINGIQRQAGTFTVTNVSLTLSQSVNLYGLDQSAQPVYTVQDNAGNQWQLQTTHLGVGPGTFSYAFQAANPGATLTVPNTITVPVTIVLGVTSINNPSTYTTLGISEESDAALKIRRQKSVSLPSQGYLAGLLAALENITGVSAAFVYENTGATTDANGVPGHSIWVIVSGSGAAASIAQAIYTKRNAGCGMRGNTSYVITQADGSSFVVYWDVVVPENLFITFTATSLNGTSSPNLAAILAGLPTSFAPGVAAEVNINQLATLVQAIDPNTLVTASGFNNGQVQVLSFSAVAASGTFELSYNGNSTAAINWNDTASTIQTKLRAVTGLSTAVVSGSIAGQSLTINLSSVSSVLGFITPTANSLMTSAPASITIGSGGSYTNTLSPSQKNYQFDITAANILILPMILSPQTVSVGPSSTQTFTGLGGMAPYTYSIQTNNSGGNINSTSGLYTSGSTGNVVDTILVTDAFGNTATATVTVT